MRRLVIDADSHIDESEAIWDYLPKEYQNRRPIPFTVDRERAPYMGDWNGFWLIDGRSSSWTFGKGAQLSGIPANTDIMSKRDMSVESIWLTDTAARVADLDRTGIDIQVLHSTLFNHSLSADIGFHTALMRAWNDFMADKCDEAPDRLKFSALVPLHDRPDVAIAEIERVRARGAASLCVAGGTAGNRWLHDRAFDPIWECAQSLDIPITCHIGYSWQPMLDMFDDVGASLAFDRVFMFMGYYSFTAGGILARFPRLRCAFMESGVTSLKWMTDQQDDLWKFVNKLHDGRGVEPKTPEPPSRYMDRVYLTCLGSEKGVDMGVEYLGEGQILWSVDMVHHPVPDNAPDIFLARTDVPDSAKEKIVYQNAFRYYGPGLKVAMPEPAVAV